MVIASNQDRTALNRLLSFPDIALLSKFPQPSLNFRHSHNSNHSSNSGSQPLGNNPKHQLNQNLKLFLVLPISDPMNLK